MLYLAIGLAAGVLSGLFGIGGGVVIVPALLYFARFEPATATGTSLAALLLPVGALGAWKFWQEGHVQVRPALLVAAGLVVGAFVGATFALDLAPRTLQRAFASFLAVVAVYVWWSA